MVYILQKIQLIYRCAFSLQQFVKFYCVFKLFPIEISFISMMGSQLFFNSISIYSLLSNYEIIAEFSSRGLSKVNSPLLS
jgi:hypothetical protein